MPQNERKIDISKENVEGMWKSIKMYTVMLMRK